MNKRNKAFPQESPIWNFYTLKKMTAFCAVIFFVACRILVRI